MKTEYSYQHCTQMFYFHGTLHNILIQFSVLYTQTLESIAFSFTIITIHLCNVLEFIHSAHPTLNRSSLLRILISNG